MKRIFAFLLACCVCLGLCACNKSSESQAQSTEARTADKLILAIGSVTLEKEPQVLAAKAYYDTLTEEQKAQVGNAAILEAAVEDLTALKNEAAYNQIYLEAVELEDNAAFQAASEKFATLPTEYKDVALRYNVTTLLAQLSGTWKCENRYATSNKGTVLVTWAERIILTPKEGGSYDDNPTNGKTIKFTVNHSLHAYSKGDTPIIDSFSAQVLKDISGTTNVFLQNNGEYKIATTTSFDGTYNCVVTHILRADGKLEVTFDYSTYDNKTNITSATYVYIKEP